MTLALTTAGQSGTAWCCGANWRKQRPNSPKGAYVEVEGEVRHRSYQKEVQVGKKAVTVDIPVTEIHARILRKLDRSTSAAESELTEEAPE